MNSASRSVRGSRAADMGRRNRNVPEPMSAVKLSTSTCAGENWRRGVSGASASFGEACERVPMQSQDERIAFRPRRTVPQGLLRNSAGSLR